MSSFRERQFHASQNCPLPPYLSYKWPDLLSPHRVWTQTRRRLSAFFLDHGPSPSQDGPQAPPRGARPSRLSTLIYLKRGKKATDASSALQERRCVYPPAPGEDQAATVPRIAARPKDSIPLAKSNLPQITVPTRISSPRMGRLPGQHLESLLLSISAIDSLWKRYQEHTRNPQEIQGVNPEGVRQKLPESQENPFLATRPSGESFSSIDASHNIWISRFNRREQHVKAIPCPN